MKTITLVGACSSTKPRACSPLHGHGTNMYQYLIHPYTNFTNYTLYQCILAISAHASSSTSDTDRSSNLETGRPRPTTVRRRSEVDFIQVTKPSNERNIQLTATFSERTASTASRTTRTKTPVRRKTSSLRVTDSGSGETPKSHLAPFLKSRHHSAEIGRYWKYASDIDTG